MILLSFPKEKKLFSDLLSIVTLTICLMAIYFVRVTHEEVDDFVLLQVVDDYFVSLSDDRHDGVVV